MSFWGVPAQLHQMNAVDANSDLAIYFFRAHNRQMDTTETGRLCTTVELPLVKFEHRLVKEETQKWFWIVFGFSKTRSPV
jgi:hypothetical protein